MYETWDVSSDPKMGSACVIILKTHIHYNTTNPIRKLWGKVLGSCQAHGDKRVFSKILFSLESLNVIVGSKFSFLKVMGSLLIFDTTSAKIPKSE